MVEKAGQALGLTWIFSVELPGIAPVSLPGDMHAELQLHYISIQLSPAPYLWFCFGS
jgi:hypothetical protein